VFPHPPLRTRRAPFRCNGLSIYGLVYSPQSEAIPSQTDSVHTSPGHSSAQPLRPSTEGLPDGLARHQTLYAALPRSQYYAPSAMLRPLQPQVVQSPRDGSQRFPRSRDCPLYSGLGRSWTPVGCSLHPRRGLYACTPLAGTIWPIGPLARSVLEPSYATTHAILIISKRVHASDALNGASSRSHTRVQAGGLRVWMRCCPLPLVPSGFGRVLPPCPSPAELASGSLGYAPVSTGVIHHLLPRHLSITVTCFVAHRTGRERFRLISALQ